jgi:hypothetical protein
LKPYKFIEDKTLQHVLTKPSDLVIDELVQIEELEDLQRVGFERVNNYLTHGNIIGTYVPIHYYHDVPFEYNNVTICNDQNDTFNETLIDVYILEVYNPKGHFYS